MFDGLSVRIKNVLSHAKIDTIDELCLCSREELLTMKQCGVKMVDELESWLASKSRRLICGDCKKAVTKFLPKLNAYHRWW